MPIVMADVGIVRPLRPIARYDLATIAMIGRHHAVVPMLWIVSNAAIVDQAIVSRAG
ncbi:hypothetical protein [Sphingomonas sp. OK281]|uniref:hypothetical protein n=1 Tax=Sphingomonas sp. OK281 TaxID=1881067 RepID=UPI0015876A89|nr:hypothetical protein [Sphingomonas sp. OK281]